VGEFAGWNRRRKIAFRNTPEKYFHKNGGHALGRRNLTAKIFQVAFTSAKCRRKVRRLIEAAINL
jgi:hypothetical protein